MFGTRQVTFQILAVICYHFSHSFLDIFPPLTIYHGGIARLSFHLITRNFWEINPSDCAKSCILVIMLIPGILRFPNTSFAIFSYFSALLSQMKLLESLQMKTIQHATNSILFIESQNFLSVINRLTWCSSNIPAFSFSLLKLGTLL